MYQAGVIVAIPDSEAGLPLDFLYGVRVRLFRLFRRVPLGRGRLGYPVLLVAYIGCRRAELFSVSARRQERPVLHRGSFFRLRREVALLM